MEFARKAKMVKGTRFEKEEIGPPTSASDAYRFGSALPIYAFEHSPSQLKARSSGSMSIAAQRAVPKEQKGFPVCFHVVTVNS